jgi:predicted Ser/Thr protein kinase
MNEFTPEQLGSDPPDAEDTGQRIGHHYAVSGVLGRGGMGEVFKALDTRNGRTVAIKMIDPVQAQDAETLRRFEREARSVQALDHPNIARIFGMEYDEKHNPFIVMEYVEGESLDRIAKGTEDVPYSVLCDYMVQAARGLEAAQRRSIIHRDIKPSNLLVTQDGLLKIIDFGLAKSMFDRSFVTATGMVVGTPRYISPEQGMGRTVDHRSDIYSLGATFYELMTRQCPFDGDTALAIMMKHINSPLTPPYMINPKVPGDINEIICKMMAKDPGERYQDYEGAIRDLEAAKIHRMAKEKRRAIGPSAGLTPETDFAEGEGDAVITGTGRSSYLTEGFVNIRVAELPDPDTPTPKARVVLLTLVGLVIVLIAGISLVQAKRARERGEPSMLAKVVVRFFERGEKKPEPLKPEEYAVLDGQRISQTQQRMESVLNKVIDWRRGAGGGEIPTIRKLRLAKVVGVEESQDAWGNDFFISSANGGELIALGRDNAEGTEDDFRYKLTGVQAQLPKALTEADAAVILQAQKETSGK